MPIRIPSRHNPALQRVVERINADDELHQWWRCANINAVDRLGMSDHGEVHIRIVSNIALRMLRLLVDAWGSPLAYRSFTQYPPAADRVAIPARAVNDANVDSDDPPKADSYQLWSFGPNRINEAGAKTGGCDDIANWHSL